MPHTECAHRQARTQTSHRRPPAHTQRTASFAQTHGAHAKSNALRWGWRGLHVEDAACTDTFGPPSRRPLLLHINLYPQHGGQSRNVNSSTAPRPSALLAPLLTAGRGPPGTGTRRWSPPSSAGPTSHSQSRCKCPRGGGDGAEDSSVSWVPTSADARKNHSLFALYNSAGCTWKGKEGAPEQSHLNISLQNSLQTGGWLPDQSWIGCHQLRVKVYTWLGHRSTQATHLLNAWLTFDCCSSQQLTELQLRFW